MARLTEREMDLIVRARQASPFDAEDVNAAIQQARHLRSEFMAEALGRAARALARRSGLATAARFLADAALRPLRKALLKSRTVRELRRLDDRMLLDIGLTRGDVEVFAGTLAEQRLPAAPARPSLAARLGAWLQRRRTIRALEALDDRLLADIGLERDRIAVAADFAVAGGSKATPAAAPKDVVNATYGALRRWNLSRQAAREMSKLGPDVLSDLGYVKGDVDWVPEVLANRRVNRDKAA